jgi:hypothetical protein
MTPLPTLLLALTTAASLPPGDPPRPSDLAFDLPDGFARHEARVEGQPVSLGTGPAGEAVAVLLRDAPAALECGRADGAQRGLVQLRTRGGIDGCLAVHREASGALALAQVSTGSASATVAVLAPDEDSARRLALRVAGSLRAARPVVPAP